MKYLTTALAAAAILALSLPAQAAIDSTEPENQSIWIGSFGHFNNWHAVSRDELILWASPSRPYLVKIWRPFRGLRFANAIGVTSTAGRVTKFDSVIVNGQRRPIKSIVALTRDEAKALRYSKS